MKIHGNPFSTILEINLDVPKKRIPRAEFHGIFLDFVEYGIAHEVESPYFCLKSGISTLIQLNFGLLRLKFFFLGSNTDLKCF